MLVDYVGKSGAKVIQIPNSKEMVVLSQGYNQIPDESWKTVRDLVLCQIADGKIIEEWIDVEKNGAKHKEAVLFVKSDDPKTADTTVRVPATFKDITRKRTDAVIAETFNTKTLQDWYDNESRDDVRVKIFRQMEGIKDGSITGEKKK